MKLQTSVVWRSHQQFSLEILLCALVEFSETVQNIYPVDYE